MSRDHVARIEAESAPPVVVEFISDEEALTEPAVTTATIQIPVILTAPAVEGPQAVADAVVVHDTSPWNVNVRLQPPPVELELAQVVDSPEPVPASVHLGVLHQGRVLPKLSSGVEFGVRWFLVGLSAVIAAGSAVLLILTWSM